MLSQPTSVSVQPVPGAVYRGNLVINIETRLQYEFDPIGPLTPQACATPLDHCDLPVSVVFALRRLLWYTIAYFMFIVLAYVAILLLQEN